MPIWRLNCGLGSYILFLYRKLCPRKFILHQIYNTQTWPSMETCVGCCNYICRTSGHWCGGNYEFILLPAGYHTWAVYFAKVFHRVHSSLGNSCCWRMSIQRSWVFWVSILYMGAATHKAWNAACLRTRRRLYHKSKGKSGILVANSQGSFWSPRETFDILGHLQSLLFWDCRSLASAVHVHDAEYYSDFLHLWAIELHR